MKITVIHHSADFDGIFCREIARKFLPEAELIGWDFGDPTLPIPDGQIYILDLPVDRVFGAQFTKIGEGLPLCVWPPKGESKEAQEAAIDACIKFDKALPNTVWIDHHKSSIETHSPNIPGYRIDGVAACRLAWQWFAVNEHNAQNRTNEALQVPLPGKQEFIDRTVSEPLAVRLAGEYDIWDKRDPRAELLQHGLRSRDLTGWWEHMLGHQTIDKITVAEIEALMEKGQKIELRPDGKANLRGIAEQIVENLLKRGEAIKFARDKEYREVITQQGFDLYFEGLTFLACNSHELDIRSQLFEAGIKPHHDALLGFTFHGKGYRVSLYRIPGKETDILSIAKKYGGGGHAGACGMQMAKLDFLP